MASPLREQHTLNHRSLGRTITNKTIQMIFEMLGSIQPAEADDSEFRNW